ncbi:MAG: hypothetical protein LBR38_08465 [Synergistaceae bacterium]|nr:hypothetical protein [Synergistaceae bacterium]
MLADVVLGEGVLANAANQILLRTGGDAEGITGLFGRVVAVLKNVYMLLPLSVLPGNYDEVHDVLHAFVKSLAGMDGPVTARLAFAFRGAFALFPFSMFANAAIVFATLAVYACLLAPAVFSKAPSRRRRLGAPMCLCLLALFIAPYVWYFLTAEHAFIHAYFTFRCQVSSVWLFLILPNLVRASPLDGEGKIHKIKDGISSA